MNFIVENGVFIFMIGSNSRDTQNISYTFNKKNIVISYFNIIFAIGQFFINNLNLKT